MNDKELCRAWIDENGDHHYVTSTGLHLWVGVHFSRIKNELAGRMRGLAAMAEADGFTIEWADHPGLATLVPIPDVWRDAATAWNDWRIRDGGPPSITERMIFAIQALLDAHDRGEL